MGLPEDITNSIVFESFERFDLEMMERLVYKLEGDVEDKAECRQLFTRLKLEMETRSFQLKEQEQKLHELREENKTLANQIQQLQMQGLGAQLISDGVDVGEMLNRLHLEYTQELEMKEEFIENLQQEKEEIWLELNGEREKIRDLLFKLELRQISSENDNKLATQSNGLSSLKEDHTNCIVPNIDMIAQQLVGLEPTSHSSGNAEDVFTLTAAVRDWEQRYNHLQQKNEQLQQEIEQIRMEQLIGSPVDQMMQDEQMSELKAMVSKLEDRDKHNLQTIESLQKSCEAKAEVARDFERQLLERPVGGVAQQQKGFIEQLNQQLQALQAEVTQLKEDNQILQEKVSAAANNASNGSKENLDQKQSMQQLQIQLEIVNNERMKIEQELVMLQSTNSVTEKENAQLQQKISELESVSEKLTQQQMVTTNGDDLLKKQHEQTIELLQKQIVEYKAQIQQQLIDFDVYRGRVQENESALRQQLEVKSAEWNKERNETLQQLDSQRQAFENEQQNISAQYEKQLEQANEQFLRVKEELLQANQQESKKLAAKISALENANRHLEQQIREKQNNESLYTEQIAKLEYDLQELRQEHEKILQSQQQQQLDAAIPSKDQIVAQLELENGVLLQNVHNLEDQLQQVQSEEEQYRAEFQLRDAKIAELQQFIQLTLDQNISQRDDKIQELEGYIAHTVSHEISKREDKIQELQRVIQITLKQEVAQKDEKIEELERRLEHSESHLEQAENRLQQAESESASSQALRQELEELDRSTRREIEKLKSLVGQKEKHIQQLQERNAFSINSFASQGDNQNHENSVIQPNSSSPLRRYEETSFYRLDSAMQRQLLNNQSSLTPVATDKSFKEDKNISSDSQIVLSQKDYLFERLRVPSEHCSTNSKRLQSQNSEDRLLNEQNSNKSLQQSNGTNTGAGPSQSQAQIIQANSTLDEMYAKCIQRSKNLLNKNEALLHTLKNAHLNLGQYSAEKIRSSPSAHEKHEGTQNDQQHQQSFYVLNNSGNSSQSPDKQRKQQLLSNNNKQPVGQQQQYYQVSHFDGVSQPQAFSLNPQRTVAGNAFAAINGPQQSQFNFKQQQQRTTAPVIGKHLLIMTPDSDSSQRKRQEEMAQLQLFSNGSTTYAQAQVRSSKNGSNSKSPESAARQPLDTMFENAVERSESTLNKYQNTQQQQPQSQQQTQQNRPQRSYSHNNTAAGIGLQRDIPPPKPDVFQKSSALGSGKGAGAGGGASSALLQTHAQSVMSKQLKINQQKYEGEKLGNLRHGRGRMWYGNGEVYEGEWKSDKRHGYGILRDVSGELYNGDWEFDMYHGQGRLRNQRVEGLQRDFDFRNFEKMKNYWTSYSGEFRSNCMHGLGTLVLSNGEKFLGSFAGGKVHGEGTFYRLNGEIQVGFWQNNKFVGNL